MLLVVSFDVILYVYSLVYSSNSLPVASGNTPPLVLWACTYNVCIGTMGGAQGQALVQGEVG